MAEVSMSTNPKAVGWCNPVQELVENGHDLPQTYITAYSGPTSDQTADIPVIDLRRWDSAEELLTLRSALTSWGCFQVINHGIENWFLDEVRKLSREFFHLPMEEKLKYAREGDDFQGYGKDLLLHENQALDWNDRLHLRVAPQRLHNYKFWPQNPPSLMKALHEYTAELKRVAEQLLKLIAKSLGLAEGCFLSKFGDELTMAARLNYYPQCLKADQILGLKPHADGSAITILLQDEQVRGLQLLKGDQWFWVPILPHALVFNVGDQLEIISNGICKSPIHRAIVNPEKERSSLAMFISPDVEKEIEPVEELVDENNGRPRLFKKVVNYGKTYFHYYQLGKRPIDAVRI